MTDTLILDEALAAVLRDVVKERLRQVDGEGFRRERDDRYVDGELAAVAATFAANDRWLRYDSGDRLGARVWPASWDMLWFKSASRRNQLVKAAALLFAEIERLDREA